MRSHIALTIIISHVKEKHELTFAHVLIIECTGHPLFLIKLCSLVTFVAVHCYYGFKLILCVVSKHSSRLIIIEIEHYGFFFSIWSNFSALIAIRTRRSANLPTERPRRPYEFHFSFFWSWRTFLPLWHSYHWLSRDVASINTLIRQKIVKPNTKICKKQIEKFVRSAGSLRNSADWASSTDCNNGSDTNPAGSTNYFLV